MSLSYFISISHFSKLALNMNNAKHFIIYGLKYYHYYHELIAIKYTLK